VSGKLRRSLDDSAAMMAMGAIGLRVPRLPDAHHPPYTSADRRVGFVRLFSVDRQPAGQGDFSLQNPSRFARPNN
jgi:hypothetical protein